VALRYSNVYGPRQNPHGEAGVVATFLNRWLAGQPATINGDGRYVRDYVHVADVARANVLALTAGAEVVAPGTLTAFNVGTGIGVDRQPGGERCSLITAGRCADPSAAAAEIVRLHRTGRGMVEQWRRGTSQTLASAAAMTS